MCNRGRLKQPLSIPGGGRTTGRACLSVPIWPNLGWEEEGGSELGTCIPGYTERVMVHYNLGLVAASAAASSCRAKSRGQRLRAAWGLLLTGDAPPESQRRSSSCPGSRRACPKHTVGREQTQSPGQHGRRTCLPPPRLRPRDLLSEAPTRGSRLGPAPHQSPAHSFRTIVRPQEILVPRGPTTGLRVYLRERLRLPRSRCQAWQPCTLDAAA